MQVCGFLWYIVSCIPPWIMSRYGKIWLTENLIENLHILCSIQPSLLVNLRTTFFSVALAKFCAWSAKFAALKFSSAFFLQPRVTVYIFGSVTIHLLGINTECTEFQSNSTGFKSVSGADIRFEQFKMT